MFSEYKCRGGREEETSVRDNNQAFSAAAYLAAKLKCDPTLSDSIFTRYPEFKNISHRKLKTILDYLICKSSNFDIFSFF